MCPWEGGWVLSWGEGLQAHFPDSKKGHPGVHLVAGASCLPSSHCREAAGPKTPLRREGKPEGETRGGARGGVRPRSASRKGGHMSAQPRLAAQTRTPTSTSELGSSLRLHEVMEPLADPEPASGPGPHRLRSDLGLSPPHVPPRLHSSKARGGGDTGSDQSDASL